MVKRVKGSHFGVSAVVAAMALLCVLATGSAAAGGDTTRVSVASDGTEANHLSQSPSISADGRFVAFSSHASNLVPGDTNKESDGDPLSDIFVRDRDADNDGVLDETDQPGVTQTERISVDSAGEQSNGHSGVPSISADGRFVAFTSWATNLVPGDTNIDTLGRPAGDIFVHDRQAGTTERVSVDSSETEANNYSHFPSISADGRFVAFKSPASNLVANDTNNAEDIFVRDRQAGTTELVSVGSGTWSKYGFSISADGRYVAFISGSPTLVPNDANGRPDVFVRDLVDDTTVLIRAECAAFDCGYRSTTSISADGRYVAFASDATNLVDGDTNGHPDVFVHDRDTDDDGVFGEVGAISTERVSVDSSNAEADGDSTHPDISADGRFVVFESGATNLVENDANNALDVFMHDRQTGTTRRASVDGSQTEANGASRSGEISADGCHTTFYSGATNLIETDANQLTDVFAHERDIPLPNDCIAPTTTASATIGSGTAYEQGTWANKDVTVRFSAQDNEGGSGIQEIRYSATGAQSIAQTVYDEQEFPVISTEGITTIRYYATDEAGNREYLPKTFEVKLDKSAPTLDTDSSDGRDGIMPDNGQTGVRRDTQPTATFSDRMDPASLSASARLYQWKAVEMVWQQVPAEVSVEGKTATLDPYPRDPARLLAAGKKFKVTVTTGATNVAGIPMSRTRSWTFETTADRTAPTVTAVTPARGKTGVSRSTSIKATFSEKMDGISVVTPTNFTVVKKGSSSPVAFRSIGCCSATNEATFDPSSSLEPNTAYTATIKGGNTGAKDLVGNPLAQDFSWTFTTGN